MLTTIALLAALAAPASPSPTPSSLAAGSVPVSTTFDGRGRIHTASATWVGERLVVHGAVTAPVPFPPSRRSITLEVLGADGSVLATRTVVADRAPLRVARRHPVQAAFSASFEQVAGATSVRAALQP